MDLMDESIIFLVILILLLLALASRCTLRNRSQERLTNLNCANHVTTPGTNQADNIFYISGNNNEFSLPNNDLNPPPPKYSKHNADSLSKTVPLSYYKSNSNNIDLELMPPPYSTIQSKQMKE